MTTVKLTTEDFKTNVLDYTTQEEWNYLGKLPAIIDFYADWCGPCKMVAPVLEELAKEYDGKLVIYKVDTEKEQELINNEFIGLDESINDYFDEIKENEYRRSTFHKW